MRKTSRTDRYYEATAIGIFLLFLLPTQLSLEKGRMMIELLALFAPLAWLFFLAGALCLFFATKAHPKHWQGSVRKEIITWSITGSCFWAIALLTKAAQLFN